ALPPRQAGGSDRDVELLRAGDEVALEHHARQRALAGGDLRGELARDLGLAEVILAAVPVARVNDQPRAEARRLEALRRAPHVLGVEVRSVGPAAQND